MFAQTDPLQESLLPTHDASIDVDSRGGGDGVFAAARDSSLLASPATSHRYDSYHGSDTSEEDSLDTRSGSVLRPAAGELLNDAPMVAAQAVAAAQKEAVAAAAAGGQPPIDLYPSTRWFRWFMGILLQLAAGSLYAVSVLSAAFLQSFGCSQDSLSVALGFGDVGLFVPVIIPWVFVCIGPRLTGAFSALLVSGGYAVFYMQLNGIIPAAGLWSVALFGAAMFCIGLGSNGLNTVALNVNAVNMRKEELGFTAGVLKAAFGSSAFIITLIFQHAYGNDALNLVRLLSAVGCCMTLCAAFMTFTVDPHLILNGGKSEAAPDPRQLASIYMAPTGASASAGAHMPRSPTPSERAAGELATVGTMGSPAASTRASRTATGCALFFDGDFRTFWMAYMLCQSVGVFLIDNVNHYAENEAGGGPKQTNVAVIALSLSNAVARVSAGLITDRVLPGGCGCSKVCPKGKPIPSAWLMVAGGLLTFVAQLVLFGVHTPYVVVSSVLSGLSYGILNTSSLLLTGEYFGIESLPSNYGWSCSPKALAV